MVASSGFFPQTCGTVGWWTPSWRHSPAGCRTPAHAGSWNHPALYWKTWTLQLLRRSNEIQNLKSSYKLWRNRSALMEVKMEGQTHLSHLHRNRGGLTKQLTSEEEGQLVPITHTGILCSSQWSGVFLWWAFYNSCFRSLHHLVHITPLTQKPHARTNSSVICNSKTSYTAFPSTTKATQVFRFLSFFSFSL